MPIANDASTDICATGRLIAAMQAQSRDASQRAIDLRNYYKPETDRLAEIAEAAAMELATKAAQMSSELAERLLQNRRSDKGCAR